MHDFSDAYLGCGVLGNPATGGSGHVICIEIISSPGSKEWDRFSKDVGQEWMSLGGRASPGQALGPPTGDLRTYPGGTQSSMAL